MSPGSLPPPMTATAWALPFPTHCDVPSSELTTADLHAGPSRPASAPRTIGTALPAIARSSESQGDRREGGRGRGRGGRGGRGGFRGRGREYDRQSATGRFDGEKKEVAGKGSWGDAKTADENIEPVTYVLTCPFSPAL